VNTSSPPGNSRPWLNHYEADVPHDINAAGRVLSDLLPGSASLFPNRSALVFPVAAAGRLFHTTLNYSQLQEKVNAFAASLQTLGIAKGDRVALFLPNCPQFVIAYLGAIHIGAIAVPVNPLYSAREAEDQLKDCGARIAVTLDNFYPLIKEVQARTPLTRVIVSRIKEYFSPTLWLLYTLTKERKSPRIRLDEGDIRFQKLLTPGNPIPVKQSAEETAVLLYTGGTTGGSKGVELTHSNLMINALQNKAWAHLKEGVDINLAAVPMFHAFGSTCCLILGILTAATLVLVGNPTDTSGLLKTIDRFQPNIFPVVPTILASINNHPNVEKYDLTSVKVCPCAGSPLPKSVQTTFIRKTGVHPAEGYGLTEAAPVTMGNPPFGDNRLGTIGLPYPSTLARVVDIQTGQRDMPFNGDWTEPGEIIVKGPQVMKGFWNRPLETADQIRNGWLHTGDIGQMHRDGYFRIIDRLKDLIIRSGMKIYPAEVEGILHEHPDVLEALVIGIPDDIRGEQVKAFIVPRPESSLDEVEVKDFCARNLAKFKIPSCIEFRSSLPKSAVGKPLRRALREEEQAESA